MLPFEHGVETLAKKIKGKTGVHLEGPLVFGFGIIALFLCLAFVPLITTTAFSIALFLSPLWLPALLVSGAWHEWITWRRSDFIFRQKHILLEIKPPRSIEKTPLAMETVLSGIYLNPSESNWYARVVKGGTRPWFSLEIVSTEGQVRFYIWTRALYRRAIEAQIYAQYPGAQVVEAKDYTRMIPADPSQMEMLGCDFKHTQPDPYPIRTYVDYGLDKVQKEHEQVDPLANLVEFLGSFGKHEHFWIQYIIRVHGGEKFADRKGKDGKPYTWKDEARDEIETIREAAKFKTKITDPITGEERETAGYPLQTKGQSELIAAIERNISKIGFDVGIRGVYIADKGHFNPAVPASMKILFSQFSAAENYNGITWNTSRGRMRFEDYPWEWNLQARKDAEMRHFIDAFRRRQYFHAPHEYSDYMVMSTEELATLFHIPSHAVTTPSLPRITSATSEAPANLPT